MLDAIEGSIQPVSSNHRARESVTNVHATIGRHEPAGVFDEAVAQQNRPDRAGLRRAVPGRMLRPGRVGIVGRLILALMLVVATATAAPARDIKRAPPPPAGFHPRQLTISATVATVDYANRAVTLADPKGNNVVLLVHKSVGNLSQVKQGAKVKITYLEAVVIAIRDAGGAKTPTAGDAVQVVLPGKKPSVTMVDTIEIPATASAIDRKLRTITLVLSDGRSAVVRVDPGVKSFASLKAGAQVAVRLTQATALSVR
jgi:hypothetical protein